MTLSQAVRFSPQRPALAGRNRALLLIGVLGGLSAGLVAPTAQAQDRAEVAPTQIIGNKELPKVLYIVPWKKPQPDALVGRPLVSVMDEVMAPVDREVFRRQLQYSAAPAKAGTAETAK
jgi:hypothetical protein